MYIVSISEKEFNELDINKEYYFFYIKFNKSGFSVKYTPQTCYISKTGGCISLYLTEMDKINNKSYFYVYPGTRSYDNSIKSGIFSTIEGCINEYNHVIDARVETVTKEYNKHLSKLTKSQIRL